MQHSSDTSKTTGLGLDLGRIRHAVGPVLSAHGITLVDVEWLTERGNWTLRLTIEREGSLQAGFGVSLDDCADVSRDVSALLDVEDLIPHHYHLEVSSPGLDRPLRSPADFSRFVGQTAKVKLRVAAPDGQRVLRGRLAEDSAGLVAVIADGKRFELPFAHVAEAHLVFELPKQPKKPAEGRAGRRQDDKRSGARGHDRSQAPHGRSHQKAPQGKLNKDKGHGRRPDEPKR